MDGQRATCSDGPPAWSNGVGRSGCASSSWRRCARTPTLLVAPIIAVGARVAPAVRLDIACASACLVRGTAGSSGRARENSDPSDAAGSGLATPTRPDPPKTTRRAEPCHPFEGSTQAARRWRRLPSRGTSPCALVEGPSLTCASCGSENRRGARFCRGCGASLQNRCPNAGLRWRRDRPTATRVARGSVVRLPGSGSPGSHLGTAARVGAVRGSRRLQGALGVSRRRRGT
jgi:hypothetical protein